MADRPILYSAAMIEAQLDDRKTQTRRVLSPRHFRMFDGTGRSWSPSKQLLADALKEAKGFRFLRGTDVVEWGAKAFPYQAPAERTNWLAHFRPAVGDRLWVKENHAIVPRTAYRMSEGVQQTLRPGDDHDAAVYAAGWERSRPGRWRPSIHMPRWASRLTNIVTEVRIQRLHDITEADAIAEGIEPSDRFPDRYLTPAGDCAVPVIAYQRLWEKINGPTSWSENPWVAAYTFTVIKSNIDEVPA